MAQTHGTDPVPLVGQNRPGAYRIAGVLQVMQLGLPHELQAIWRQVELVREDVQNQSIAIRSAMRNPFWLPMHNSWNLPLEKAEEYCSSVTVFV